MSKPCANRVVRAAHRLGMAGLIGVLCCETSLALTPPRPGELAGYQNDGTLAERLDRAQALGNDRLDPRLTLGLRQRLATARGQPAPAFAPPLDWRGGLPATGSPRTLVILVDFPDCPHTGGTTRCPGAVSSTLDDVAEKIFGTGAPADAPYESLRTYYQRASYDTLHIDGEVLGWYRAKRNRAYYRSLDYPDGNETLIMEALDHYADQGHGFAQYDNDGDGYIDALFLKWSGPDNGWANFWWAYQSGWSRNSGYRIDGKALGKYVWSWIENPEQGERVYTPRIDIHETGHLLGLPDYYDYDPRVGPQNGTGGFDMMDGTWGDHNAFSKTMLGWVEPMVVSGGAQRIGLYPTAEAPHAVMVTHHPEQGIFGDLFLAEYRRLGTGNDPSVFSNGTPGTSGLAIWHVNAALDAQGRDFLNDNSYTSHKLLRLMEADGLEDIERSATPYAANAGDLYVHPNTLTPSTWPNSHLYDPNSTDFEATIPSDIRITDLSDGGGSTLAATFAIGESVVVSPQSYDRKVRAYFQGALGHAPTTEELDVWANVLFDNTGSVWRPTGAGLQPHVSDLAGWGTDVPTPDEASALVDTVLTNLFGTASGLDPLIPDYYVVHLLDGGVRPRGLVNAVINDLGIMPRVDGTYGRPNGWTGGPGTGLLTQDQIDAYRALVEAED